jgi:formate dehydrogenase subunit delta
MNEIATDQAARLARMARQIADFFRSQPGDKAVAAIADHINHFWTLRMRTEFFDYARKHSGDVDPLVARSLPLIKTTKSAAST